MLKIGTIPLKNKIVLAPMAGITDQPFRRVVKDFHPGLVCSEMISAMALHYQSKPTQLLMQIDPEGTSDFDANIWFRPGCYG